MWSSDESDDLFDDVKSSNKRGRRGVNGGDIKTPKAFDIPALKRKAVELLARREYSFHELETKLMPLAESEDDAYAALEWLVQQGLQSDERFCEMYLRSKALSGYGPVRIRMELKQKGINQNLIEQTFEEQEVDWALELERLTTKKLQGCDAGDLKAKQKCVGFLQRRGFTLDQIYRAMDHFFRDSACD